MRNFWNFECKWWFYGTKMLLTINWKIVLLLWWNCPRLFCNNCRFSNSNGLLYTVNLQKSHRFLIQYAVWHHIPKFPRYSDENHSKIHSSLHNKWHINKYKYTDQQFTNGWVINGDSHSLKKKPSLSLSIHHVSFFTRFSYSYTLRSHANYNMEIFLFFIFGSKTMCVSA